MFFDFPIRAVIEFRQLVLVLNTMLLIAALIVVEVVYTEAPKDKKQNLKFFLPLFIVMSILVIYAVYLQSKG